jgi:hypothetical protein
MGGRSAMTLKKGQDGKKRSRGPAPTVVQPWSKAFQKKISIRLSSAINWTGGIPQDHC